MLGASAMRVEQFQTLLQQGYRYIPVYDVMPADLDTPLGAYAKLAAQAGSFLLESVTGGETWGRYSVIGCPTQTWLDVQGDTATLRRAGGIVEQYQGADPLTWINTLLLQYRAPVLPQLPRFCGGLVGYFGYDTVRYVEPRLRTGGPPNTLSCPCIRLLWCDEVVVFDKLREQLIAVVHVDAQQTDAWQQGQQRLARIRAVLERPIPPLPAICVTDTPTAELDFQSNFTCARFARVVREIQEYILSGEVMQVVPSQRMSAPFTTPPLQMYRVLRVLNPSPYMFYMDLSDLHLVGSSPEVLVRVEQGTITVRPLAGTRPRGRSAAEDLALEHELLADPKERAEHLMLIDLGRNDVGRVAQPGSVRVTEQMVVERYSHVMHMMSNVVGQMPRQCGVMDVLRATFPAGTVSGAPKIRAMQVIDLLEPEGRGAYAGAVGYLSWSGNIDLAIAIRTAMVRDGVLHVQAGAGVVADSDPHQEWRETLNKGRALLRAASLAAHDDGR